MHDSATPLMPLTTSQDVQGSLAPAAFNSIALRERLAHVSRGAFPSGSLDLDQIAPLGDVEIAERSAGASAVLLRIEPCMVVLVSLARGQGQLAVAGIDREDV